MRRVFTLSDNLLVDEVPASLPTGWLGATFPIEPPKPDPQAERRAAFQRLRAEEDERARQRSVDVTRFDDPVGRLSTPALVDQFAATRKGSLEAVSKLLLGETAHLTSLADASRLLRQLVGEGAQFNPTFARGAIRGLYEVLFLQEFSKEIKLDPSVRDHLLQRFIDREFGPKPTEISMRSYGGDSTNSRREPPVRRRDRQKDAAGQLDRLTNAIKSSRGEAPTPNRPRQGGSSPYGV